MDPIELLKTWPGWAKANAETVFASPAWRMPVTFDGGEAFLRLSADRPSDMLGVALSLDGEPHVLGLAASPAFPDLSLLWDKRASLPDALLLALVEKECGPVLQMIEDTSHRQVSVKGLVPVSDVGSSADRTFVLSREGAESIVWTFDVNDALALQCGRIEYLDTSHPQIRESVRTAEPEYATVMLLAEERGSFKTGDFILLPETMPEPKWVTDEPDDDALHVRGTATAEISFAAFADEALPPVPEASGPLKIVRRGRVVARGTVRKVGLAPALFVESADS